MPSYFRREYEPLLRDLRPGLSRAEAMAQVCDLIWNAFGERSGAHTPERPVFSWVGFYEKAAGDEMLLVARRDKPACSPIGLFGACGQCWASRQTLIIDDVATMGAGYIACDPRDQAELVIPLLNADGTCWGVLDADSHQKAAFNEHDAEQVSRMLERAGLTASLSAIPIIRR
jgi:putative methionine-R-sulfoxide reductase with GAF domain